MVIAGFLPTVRIGDRPVGRGHPCFIVAEAGVNHNGDPDLACRMIDVAADAGADAVKFQTFSADRLATPSAPKADYQRAASTGGESQLEMLRRLELPRAVYPDLMSRCRRRGVLFMSTPFDEDSANFLDDLGVAVFKVGSGDITNVPLLRHLAGKGRPLIVSTGMSSLADVEAAVCAVVEAGGRDLVLLHCVSNYPAEPADANLRAMHTLELAFGRPVGYSDHTVGCEVALGAVALGASVIEKHFTLDAGLPGPDHRASLEPAGLATLVSGVRTVEAALGHGRKEPVASEARTAAVARRSLVAAVDIPAGKVLTEDLIAVKRPGTGLPPAMLSQRTGRVTRRAIAAGTLFTLEMLV